MSEWEAKCWGMVRHIFASPHAAVSHLLVKRRTRCSWHFHQYRVNLFYVLSGEIVVEWKHDDYDHCRIRLKARDVCSVPPSVPHRFRVVEDGELIEIYWPERPSDAVTLDDIHRLDVGGEDHEWEELCSQSQ